MTRGSTGWLEWPTEPAAWANHPHHNNHSTVRSLQAPWYMLMLTGKETIGLHYPGLTPLHNLEDSNKCPRKAEHWRTIKAKRFMHVTKLAVELSLLRTNEFMSGMSIGTVANFQVFQDYFNTRVNKINNYFPKTNLIKFALILVEYTVNRRNILL